MIKSDAGDEQYFSTLLKIHFYTGIVRSLGRRVKTFFYSVTRYTKDFFGSVLKSPTHMGSLSINNSVTNISLYHRERILRTSTLSCNEEEEEITKPPTR